MGKNAKIVALAILEGKARAAALFLETEGILSPAKARDLSFRITKQVQKELLRLKKEAWKEYRKRAHNIPEGDLGKGLAGEAPP